MSGQGQASRSPPISVGDLKKILEDHRTWLQSQGREGHRAELSYHDLRGQDLSGADLQRAELAHTHLRGVDLSKTNLSEANLEGANLREAKLHGTDLWGARLQDADLSDVEGLLGEQLAGADLSRARLPQAVQTFERLATVEEASRNAQTLLVSMLLGCVYSGLTIATTIDARLLTNSASSPLPILGTPIPIVGFYVAAPLLLLCVYLYFHLYLQRLWERLAKLPAIFPDGRALDEKAYPWLLIGLVRGHFVRLKSSRPPLSRLQVWLSVLLAWYVVPVTLILFWVRYLRRHDWTVTALHIGLIVAAAVAAEALYRLAVATLRRETFKPFFWKKALMDKRFYTALGTAIAFVLMSDTFINGPPGLVYRANLFQADVSTKPSSWTGLKEREEEEIALVKGAPLSYADLRYAIAVQAFLVKADLLKADLQGANLGFAQLQGAFLVMADLREANLTGADLRRADLTGADLEGANLELARLDNANLRGAKLSGARLYQAHLEGAIVVPDQIKAAVMYQYAYYSDHLRKGLGLAPNPDGTAEKKPAKPSLRP